jgi:CheY-like chemotaxis protein
VRHRALYERVLAATGRDVPSTAELPGADIGMPKRSARVLVVEDNPVNQTVIREFLTVLGQRPRIVADGPAALEALSRDTYDLVFMDCSLPGMDGFETTAKIRSREAEGEHIPIVALTARALAADRERCLAAGMDDHLAKPITEAALVDALARWCPRPATAVDDAPEVLNADVWANLAKIQRAKGRGFSVELVDLFIKDSTARLRRIRGALESGRAEEIAKEAHALRGGCHSVGANGMADLCDELEKIVRATGLQGAAELLDSISSEFATVQLALKHRVDSLI